jgi:pyruvate,orthophosphate dikinase
LLRPDTNTADIAGFVVSTGIVTAAGGRTAHAALVARQMGKPCIVGTKALVINAASHSAEVSGVTLNEGDWLSIDGETGAIYLGRCDVAVDRPEAELAEVERWRRISK